ncbi:MAG: LptF/LptG family permease [Candidatus Margulisbacteria bacterium]|nr:LptF/LptG family permease [Candidatus Margulisiibacteriota bacterium]MBU1021331.1 LptF/LptG family permease [Candidatus Margulisiibacteriota bacterium]MBU1729180.1 LptF/LptG family permease [Candidatus Margulisiibacteriota bacterium]MBU1954853.1 LptF/LptG family permease [Candidatus Margulisiibacteriota bacterium]
MLKIIDRYILKELIDPFLFGLGSFTAVLSASVSLFGLVQAVIIKGMPLWVAVQIYLYELPGTMVYIFPMATLLAALLAFARLSGNSEIIAFRASGISLYRIIIPVMALGLAISLTALVFQEIVVPESNQAAKNLLVETASKHTPQIKENVFVPELKNGELKRIFYARRMEGSVMEGVIVQEFTDGSLSQIINANQASWQGQRDQWLFKNGVIYLLTESGEYKHLIKFKEQYISIKYTPADFYVGDKNPEEMTFADLREYIALKERMGADVTDLKIQLNMKLAIPFASLVFVLIGAPLGLFPKRASSSIGFGLSIIVIFAYYILMFVSMSFGELKVLPPVVAAWLPNIITGGFGFYLLSKKAST